MTDARLPERWLTDRRLRLLSDQAHRFFITALLWCVANRTDGVFWDEDLALMPGAVVPGTVPAGGSRDWAEECVKRDLVTRAGDRWVITDFEATQSTRDELDQLERIRAADRDKKRRQRLKEVSTGPSPGQSPGTAQAGRKAGRQEGPAGNGDQ